MCLYSQYHFSIFAIFYLPVNCFAGIQFMERHAQFRFSTSSRMSPVHVFWTIVNFWYILYYTVDCFSGNFHISGIFFQNFKVSAFVFVAFFKI